MKKILLVFVAMLGISNIVAQETALDNLSSEICEYFNNHKEEINKMSYDEKIAKFGMKVLSSYIEHKDALEKEGITFDLTKGGEEGKRLGELIGFNMVKYCPEFMMALGKEHLEKGAVDESNVAKSIRGKIKRIEGEELYFLELKDVEGRIQKFMWLTNFEGSDELIGFDDKSKGKQVKLFFENVELFSPKLKEYIVRKKITKLEFLD